MSEKIKLFSELSREAFVELRKFQTQERKLLRTGYDGIDRHIGGLLPSNLLLLASGSGVGKTYTYQQMFTNFLDTELNPEAQDFVTLEYQLEMRALDLIIREVHNITHKKKRDILTQEFSEEERKEVALYYESIQDDRRHIVEESVTTAEFFSITDKFCSEHTDKKAVIIGIDHLLLILAAERGEDPLAKIAEYTNILRKKYPNVYFVYLSQLNRMNYSNIQERSNAMVPTVASIYGSSHFEFLSAYVVIMMNPFKMGVLEYMKVQEERYPELQKYMTPPNEKGYVSFNTAGCVFYFLVKTRESDVPYDNLWIEEMYISEEQKERLKMDSEARRPESKQVQFEMPVFNTQSELPMFNPKDDIF